MSKLFGAALLGLGISFSAHAQAPVVGAPGTIATPAVGTSAGVPGQPGAVVPGTVGSGTGVVAPGATTTGTSGTLYPSTGTSYPATGVPAGGTLRSDQPLGSPTTTGAQPTRRLNRGRTTTPNSNTNGNTTRP